MSRAIALVRFNDGTIVRGCYNGTSDFISEWLITDEGLKEKYDGSCFSWDSEKWEDYNNSYVDTNTIDDSEDVEIFQIMVEDFLGRAKLVEVRCLLQVQQALIV